MPSALAHNQQVLTSSSQEHSSGFECKVISTSLSLNQISGRGQASDKENHFKALSVCVNASENRGAMQGEQADRQYPVSPRPSRHPIPSPRSPIPQRRQARAESHDAGFGPFVSASPDEEMRLRSSSLSLTSPSPYSQSQSQLDYIKRISDPPVLRSGSSDNVFASHPRALQHSHTLSEIPSRLPLSNDSGYATPPYNRQVDPQLFQHQTSWPRGNGSAAGELTTNPPPFQSHFVPEGYSHRTAPLSVNVGYESIAHGPDIVLAQPYPIMPQSIPYYQQSYRADDSPFSMPAQRNTPKSPEQERGLGYQRQRMNRLADAVNGMTMMLNSLCEEEGLLTEQLQQVKLDRKNLDITTEKEINNMREANQRLAFNIQQCLRQSNEGQRVFNTGHPYPSMRTETPSPAVASVPPVTTNQTTPRSISAPQGYGQPNSSPRQPLPPRSSSEPTDDVADGERWSCPACTYLNHPLLQTCEVCEQSRVRAG